MKRLKDEDFGSSTLGRVRKWCWNLTEYPETSLLARVSNITIDLLSCLIFRQLCLPGLCLHLHGRSCSLYCCVCVVHHA